MSRSEFLYNQYAVIVGLVYVNLPFLVLPLYATLEKFDQSFLEASLDLGASQWQTFFSVLVPLRHARHRRGIAAGRSYLASAPIWCPTFSAAPAAR